MTETEQMSVTVEQLDEAINKIYELEAKCKTRSEELEEELRPVRDEIRRLDGFVANAMEALGRESYVGRGGQELRFKEKWSVTVPKGDQERSAFFGHLRDRGIFEDMITVNSRTLNAYFNKEWEEAKNRGEGMTFELPGIPQPTIHRFVDRKRVYKKAK